MKPLALILACCALLILAGPARADWQVGDGHKMHFPQLPDPNGWDVDITDRWVGDDWQCSQTGPVEDIHLWVSWFQGLPSTIQSLQVEIWSNNPGAAGTAEYSRPESFLWGQIFTVTPEMIAGPWTGDQGYYLPTAETGVIPLVVENDHTEYWQINLTDIDAPFTQLRGEIYWLVVNAQVDRSSNEFASLGWKTSLDHFMDDAVWAMPPDSNGIIFGGDLQLINGPSQPIGPMWYELRDPLEPEISLDMAFVITPEPASLALLAIGAAAMLKRWRE